MPTFSRTEYVNACFDIRARVFTREIRDLFEFLWRTTRPQRATPFLPVSLHEAYSQWIVGAKMSGCQLLNSGDDRNTLLQNARAL